MVDMVDSEQILVVRCTGARPVVDSVPEEPPRARVVGSPDPERVRATVLDRLARQGVSLQVDRALPATSPEPPFKLTSKHPYVEGRGWLECNEPWFYHAASVTPDGEVVPYVIHFRKDQVDDDKKYVEVVLNLTPGKSYAVHLRLWDLHQDGHFEVHVPGGLSAGYAAGTAEIIMVVQAEGPGWVRIRVNRYGKGSWAFLWALIVNI